MRPGRPQRPARTALGIARALDDPALIAGAPGAITMAVADPLRRDERRRWIDELLTLAHRRPEAPWLRWVQPLDARERVLAGTSLARWPSSPISTPRQRARTPWDTTLPLTAMSSRPPSPATGTAPAPPQHAPGRTASEAMFDEATAIMGERGMLNVIALLEGVAPPAALVDIEWPTPEMAAGANTYVANSLANHRLLADADDILGRVCELVPDLARDGYWLGTLSMLASAASLTANGSAAELAADLLAPCVDLTVTDPGLIYRGSGAHFAGLAAAVLERPDAADLLRYGLELHEHHGSTWMVDRSCAALHPCQ